MSLNSSAAAEQYRKLDTRGLVESASPHRLIQLMMERTLTNIGIARRHVERGEMPGKGARIGDAIGIINGLKASLNHKADGTLSANFDALYAYMMRRLLEANLHNDVGMLDEVAGLMKELKEAWDAIADEVEPAAEATAAVPAPV
jgi:flagellar protein FliS